VGPYAVRHVLAIDGTKFILDDDRWVLLRFSGTEPLLRIFAEGHSPEEAQDLLCAGKQLLPM
jgi:phosphomannomutase